MTIRLISPYVGAPEGLISASGGWDSTPRGGFITFSGNAVMLGNVNYPQGSTFNLPGVGKFYVTSSSSKQTADGIKTTISLACILAYKSNTGTSGGLGSCSEFKALSTVQTVLNDLCNMAGIPIFSLPLGNTLMYEALWLREGENALDKISEIITANGCVLYSMTGLNLICQSLESFVSNLSGTTNNFTVDVNNMSFPSKLPGGAIINGSNTVVENTPIFESISSQKDASILLVGSNVNAYDWQTKITSVNKDFVNRKMTYTETTTSASPLVEQKKIVESEFELPPPPAPFKVALDVSSCYPVDPGRIKRRKTTEMRNVTTVEQPLWLAFFTSIDANKYTDNGYTPPPIGTMVVVSEIYESWTYNTIDTPVDFGSPGTIQTNAESIYYNKAVYKVPAEINDQLASVTLGERPSFIKNKDLVLEIINNWTPVNINFSDKPSPDIYDKLYAYEMEEMAFRKDKGSNKWVGKHTLARCFAEEGLNQARERVKEFIDVAIRENTPEQIYKDEFLKFRETLQVELLEVIPKMEVIKQDWDPRSSIPSETMPKDYEIYRRPYVYIENYFGDGGLINLTAGNFNDFNGAKLAADGIRKLEKARTKTLTVTNVGQILKIKDCDSPSFSITSDGVSSTGVYLNG